uniref:Uncharacterized protein n=1 Tax=Anguilla anguilla TaxID=7936 RepID=A0A0E9SID9_ANGAN
MYVKLKVIFFNCIWLIRFMHVYNSFNIFKNVRRQTKHFLASKALLCMLLR